MNGQFCRSDSILCNCYIEQAEARSSLKSARFAVRRLFSAKFSSKDVLDGVKSSNSSSIMLSQFSASSPDFFERMSAQIKIDSPISMRLAHLFR
ncbi:hypothetical protein KOR42_06420 [Thalassoglobus neptunius]|uniref:Uncharacterized protein n=1 Tax=Thalassoglobus neptunius TaxID=1938619 RepID=A0A5C5X4X0_9PLAN|nr:hypothetical protein KOR42_06420 [Thalassoglobus neptunius]